MKTRISSKTLISGENACSMMFAEMGIRSGGFALCTEFDYYCAVCYLLLLLGFYCLHGLRLGCRGAVGPPANQPCACLAEYQDPPATVLNRCWSSTGSYPP
jgi:hypothetical protein